MRHWIFGQPRTGRIQFLRYVFVGGTSTVLDLLVYGGLLAMLGEHRYLFAAFIGYMVGLAWNYIFALLWVFQSRHSRLKEMLMVLLIALGGLFWTELFLWIGVDFGGFSPFWAKLVVVWIVLGWNFGMRKVFVFH